MKFKPCFFKTGQSIHHMKWRTHRQYVDLVTYIFSFQRGKQAKSAIVVAVCFLLTSEDLIDNIKKYYKILFLMLPVCTVARIFKAIRWYGGVFWMSLEYSLLGPLEFWGQISVAACGPNRICFITCLRWWRKHSFRNAVCCYKKREGRNNPTDVSSQIYFCSRVLSFLAWLAGRAYQVQ